MTSRLDGSALETIYVEVEARLSRALREEASRSGRTLRGMCEVILRERYPEVEAAPAARRTKR